MENDSELNLSLSLPGISSGNNDENKSEDQRNRDETGSKTQHKTVMVPTVAAVSKAINPKKKILADWSGKSKDTHLEKPANLVSKSVLNKAGTSNSNLNSSPRKSLPKIPSSSSPSKVLELVGNNDGVKNDAPSSKPYDPITNYLSPRPKFLRYDPDRSRHRGVIVPSPSGSVDSQENEENGDTAEQVILEDEDEEEDEVFEERKLGWKWEIIKCLSVFAVLVISSVYISSMNTAMSLPSPARMGYQEFGNITLRGVSLRSLEFENWMFDGRDESKVGLIENNEKIDSLEVNDHMLARVDDGDDIEAISGSLKEELVENVVPIIGEDFNQETEEEIVVFDSVCENELLDDEAQLVTSGSTDVTVEEILADFVDKMTDSEPGYQAMELANEAEIVAEGPYEETEAQKFEDRILPIGVRVVAEDTYVGKEEGSVPDEKEMVDSEAKFIDVQLENEQEMVAEYPSIVTEERNVAYHEKEMTETESESTYGELRTERQTVAEDLTVNVAERNEHSQFWMTPKKFGSLVVLSVLALMTSLLVRFYFKCKKASSKTSSPNVKLYSQTAEKSSQRLQPKVGEKVELIPKADLPSREERLDKAPSRFITNVQLLSEFDIAADFRSSVKSCTTPSTKIQESLERSKLSTPHEATSHSQPSCSKFSVADSLSNGSYISQDNMTSKKGDGKQEVTKAAPTPLRRSTRLRNRGATSP